MARKATPFWDRVKKTSGCWLWTGCKDRHGYGVLTHQQRNYRAHRFAWQLARGAIPKGEGYHGFVIGHHCDNRVCVNPAHLFLSTQHGNLLDAKHKGRNRGPLPGTLRRPPEFNHDFAARLFMRGWSAYRLAKKFGVAKSSVDSMLKRRGLSAAARTLKGRYHANSGSFKPGSPGNPKRQ